MRSLRWMYLVPNCKVKGLKVSLDLWEMFAYLIVNLSGCLNMKKGQMCLVGRILIYYGLAVGLAGLFWIVKEVFFQLVKIKGFLIKFEVANYVYQYS